MTGIFIRLISLWSFSMGVILSGQTAWAMEDNEEIISSRSSPVIEEIEDISLPSRQLFSLVEGMEQISLSSPSLFTMPFKLGFEFQVGSSICYWALNNNNIQKKPIFLVNDKNFNSPLWKVVIDTTDIEFVTEPFTFTNQLLLEECLNSIHTALKVLKKSINKNEETTFELWIKNLQETINTETYTIEVPTPEIYELVKDKPLEPQSLPWKPYFAPQVTIQHPLEYTVPLYFSLFGFESPEMFKFNDSLPLRDIFLKVHREADDKRFQEMIGGYKNKMNGLIFLHALTMLQMVPQEDATDASLLLETQEAFTKYQQVDAKMKLLIMSRRPFSSMYEDIGSKGNYVTYFKESMKHNLGFVNGIRLFNKVNYAEQFFDEITGHPINLHDSFIHYFGEEFLNNNREVISDLLENGILSTIMIRNFKDSIKVNNTPLNIIFQGNNYFDFSLMSVDKPLYNFSIDPLTGNIQGSYWEHDALSPPLFLSAENAMGRYREPLLEEDRKRYGEAIIEIRGIRNVGVWFLKKCNLQAEEIGFKFLVDPKKFISHSLSLFNYLAEFDINKYEREIFYLGIPSALYHYK